MRNNSEGSENRSFTVNAAFAKLEVIDEQKLRDWDAEMVRREQDEVVPEHLPVEILAAEALNALFFRHIDTLLNDVGLRWDGAGFFLEQAAEPTQLPRLRAL